jgi:predicted MFS family arabinose efflux permease
MYSRRTKVGVFVLEGLNALGAALYYNYLFFHMRAEFGFGNLGNLFLCALNGLVYTAACWLGGRFAQRHGYFRALRLGFSVLVVALVGGAALSRSLPGQFAAMLGWALGMALTWSSLEAITSEREPRVRLQILIGIYNVVWAAVTALAYFAGGAMMERWGARSIFLVPAGLHVAQLVLLAWLERSVANQHSTGDEANALAEAAPREEPPPNLPVPPATFLKMAWVANPFAYIAINALVPVIPRLADRLELSPTFAGFFCSIWLFARALSFALLWQWTKWHYRFRWLCGAYAAMAICFALILLSLNIWVLFAAQVFFGLASGLLYYSSLFYSMDVGETKGEHGGYHEAAIGAGICIGPAVGAASLWFFPASPNMNTWAVTGLLTAGFAWLLWLRHRRP